MSLLLELAIKQHGELVAGAGVFGGLSSIDEVVKNRALDCENSS